MRPKSAEAALSLEIKKHLASEAKKRMALGGKEKGQAILPDLQKGHARDEAAEMVGANSAYAQQTKQSTKDAPEVFDHVKQGKLNIPQAK